MHGEGLLNPEFAENMELDLAALENGGRITACSNMFYSSPNDLLLPGTARTMGDGWETSRRRDSGNDWVQVHLASRGTLNAAEFDTSYFVGNAPGVGRLSGRDGDGVWFEILPPTHLQPDTRNRFLIDDQRADHRRAARHPPRRRDGAPAAVRQPHRRRHAAHPGDVGSQRVTRGVRGEFRIRVAD